MITSLQLQEMQARLSRNTVREPAPTEDAVDCEKQLHNQILTACMVRGFQVVHSRMDMRTTCSKGTPDFIILLPEGRLLMIECKSSTGHLSPAQRLWMTMAEKLGHTVHVVRSYLEFISLID
jgi:hypothetical protein